MYAYTWCGFIKSAQSVLDFSSESYHVPGIILRIYRVYMNASKHGKKPNFKAKPYAYPSGCSDGMCCLALLLGINDVILAMDHCGNNNAFGSSQKRGRGG